MDKDIFYDQMTLRNGYFISKKLQNKIRRTGIVFIGCGLASKLAIECSRIGFTNFILVDGDTVEISNLNRQEFYTTDVGKNKAKALSEKIKLINPHARIKVIERRIDAEDVPNIIERGKIIINCADFDEVTYAVDEIAASKDKISISPLNIGLGTVVTCFSKDSVRLREMTGGVIRDDKKFLLNFYKSLSNFTLPEYIDNNLVKIMYFIFRKKYFPQNVVASNSSTLVTLYTILQYLDDKKIKFAPEPIAIDINKLISR